MPTFIMSKAYHGTKKLGKGGYIIYLQLMVCV